MHSITCTECGHTFPLEKSKIPSSTFKVKCPACRKVFQTTVDNAEIDSNFTETVHPANDLENVKEQLRQEMERTVQTQLEALRKEVLLSVASLVQPPSQGAATHPIKYSEKRAIVCESDAAIAQQLNIVLQRMGYSVQICSFASEGLGRLESGFYDVITTEIVFPDDPEGGYKILNKVNARKQDERRRMFMVVVSDRLKSIGPHAAFFHGANIFVQKSDLRNFENLFQEGVTHFNEIYSNFYELLEESAERL